MSNVLDGLRGVIHLDVLARTESISRMFMVLSIPHALIGGLAVGVHGHAPDLLIRLGQVLAA